MRTALINWVRGRIWLALVLLPLQHGAAQFVEISAEIESFGYRLHDTRNIAEARPKLTSVLCVTGTNQWYIENDFAQRQQWRFDGTNVYCRTQVKHRSENPRSAETEFTNRAWPSSDGHPLGHFGVNLPWLAFCSGAYLKREGRLVSLPAAVLRHCPDRYAYTDVTTTFPDEFGLPRTLDLFSSQALFLKSHADWDKEHSFGNRYTEWNEKTAPKLQEGVLIFHYAVLESTNVLGRNFPLRFEFLQTGRRYEQDGNWYCQGMGRVKSIRPTTELPMLK